MDGQTEFAEGVQVREYDYGDEVVYVADLGPVGDGSVDVVDGTVIVVVDGQQYELNAPEAGRPEAFMNNGVLTIEVIDE